MFDVALAQIPATGFGQAGLDRFVVNKAAEGDYEDALRFGANAGLDRKVILKELGDAKAQAWKAYPTAAATASARPSAKLLEAVRKCMPQPPPPNQ